MANLKEAFGFERARLLRKRLQEERFTEEETKQIQDAIASQQNIS